MTHLNLIKSAGLSALLASAAAFPAQAVFFHTTSGSIDGSLCVGLDCVASPAFGFDTIIVRENNLRFFFDDTSSTASFPNQDWRLIANDSANGGSEHFSIEDATLGRQVFRVFSGARANALVVDSQGDVGIGTTTPATDIDIKIGDTPTVRLQQDGTSGFTPQTWDMAGNEAGFFIRDATGGSTLPLRIRAGGAPSSSIDIAGDGDVGISTASPSAQLHVTNADASDDGIRVTNSGTNANLMRLEATNATATGVGFIMDPGTGANFWQFTATANENIFRINRTAGNGTEFELNQNGNLTVTGSLFSGGGTCGGGCDRVFDADYAVPSIEQHAALMWSDGHLPAVGPTPENAPINVSDKLGRVLNELEHAHIYIEQLNAQLKAQGEGLKAQSDEIRELRQLIALR